MLYIHPIMQLLATLAGAYALFLGWSRFRSLHLGAKAPFARDRHVLVGSAALLVWLGGMLGGIMVARLRWGAFLITGDHAYVGLAMAPLMVFGLISGYYLYRKPARRTLLPLLHGLNNLVLLGLALYQIPEGIEVLEEFVWLS